MSRLWSQLKTLRPYIVSTGFEQTAYTNGMIFRLWRDSQIN